MVDNIIGSASVQLNLDQTKFNSQLKQLSARLNSLSRNFAKAFKVLSAPVVAVGLKSVAAYLKSSDSGAVQFKQKISTLNAAMADLGKKVLSLTVFGKTSYQWVDILTNKLRALNTDQLQKMLDLLVKAGKAYLLLKIASVAVSGLKGFANFQGANNVANVAKTASAASAASAANAANVINAAKYSNKNSGVDYYSAKKSAFSNASKAARNNVPTNILGAFKKESLAMLSSWIALIAALSAVAIILKKATDISPALVEAGKSIREAILKPINIVAKTNFKTFKDVGNLASRGVAFIAESIKEVSKGGDSSFGSKLITAAVRVDENIRKLKTPIYVKPILTFTEKLNKYIGRVNDVMLSFDRNANLIPTSELNDVKISKGMIENYKAIEQSLKLKIAEAPKQEQKEKLDRLFDSNLANPNIKRMDQINTEDITDSYKKLIDELYKQLDSVKDKIKGAQQNIFSISDRKEALAKSLKDIDKAIKDKWKDYDSIGMDFEKNRLAIKDRFAGLKAPKPDVKVSGSKVAAEDFRDFFQQGVFDFQQEKEDNSKVLKEFVDEVKEERKKLLEDKVDLADKMEEVRLAIEQEKESRKEALKENNKILERTYKVEEAIRDAILTLTQPTPAVS
jgi:hypothetical protein